MIPDKCTQCGQDYPTCLKCGDKIVPIPRAGFGNSPEWRHLEPPKAGVSPHKAHPSLHIT